MQMEQVTADHVVYGSYEVARSDTGVGLEGRLSFDDGLQMSGGDQICSKHQAKDFDAQMTTMTPNAVGACMLTNFGMSKTDGNGNSLYGTSVRYSTFGMTTYATYVFGCFNDWIDISAATLTDGVYEFSGQLTRLTGTHDSIFWFVQQVALNQAPLAGTDEKLSDRFGSGMFYYNSSSGVQVVQKSGQMQLDATTRTLAEGQLTPGCVTTSGNLMAACNLVCFDLVTGLLSDATGQSARNVLVHHISVATIATLDQSSNDKKFGSKHRRMLLETATAVVEPVHTHQTNAKSITVAAGDVRLEVGSSSPSGSFGGSPGGPAGTAPGGMPAGSSPGGMPPASYSGSIVERDFDGPKNMQAVTYPVVFIGVPIVVLAIAWFVSATIMDSNYKAQKLMANGGGGGSSKDSTPNASMFNVNKQIWNGDLSTPLIHRPRRGE